METLKALDIVLVVFCLTGDDRIETTHIYDNSRSIDSVEALLKQEYGDVDILNVTR